ncbi:hypothetical protein [Mycolicibacterium peregrinum]|uniref:hypothetical protein n=1 Tax=Mycolicibacterium peregrinum TaxID=43304 RepID=UPI003AAE41F6
MKKHRTISAAAATLIAASALLGTAPLAVADESATNSGGSGTTQTHQPATKGLKPSTKAPAKLSPPKINLPKPPNPFPKRDQKLPVMPELPSTAPSWMKNLRSDINKFVKDHPAPGVRWVDKDGNPV